MGTWELSERFWVGPKKTYGVWLSWDGWRGPTFIQAIPNGSQDYTGKELYTRNQCIRHQGIVASGGTFKTLWEYGADIYNPHDVWIQFKIFGLD